jgi:uncharacterized membrane protein
MSAIKPVSVFLLQRPTMPTMSVALWSISVLLLLVFPAVSFSQTGATGALSGAVTDMNEAVLPDVRVEAINVRAALGVISCECFFSLSD